MTITTKQTAPTRWQNFSNRLRRTFGWLLTIRMVGILLLLGSFIVGTGGYIIEHEAFNLRTLVNDFYANIASELASIAITVLIIDSLYQQRQVKQEKERLIRQMSSTERGLALQAVEELKALGAIKDGSLARADLEEANLEGARLGHADLEGARMDFSNLSEVYLYFANLEGADMSGVDMRKAVLIGANLHRADMIAVKFQGALLSEADLSEAIIDKAEFDENTLLPDGSKWTPDTDMRRFTDPHHAEFWRSSLPESPAYGDRIGRRT